MSMCVAELIERLQQPDIDSNWLVTIVEDGLRTSLDHVETDYRGSSEMVVELWTTGKLP